MDIQVTEFELKFSAAMTNLTTMIANYSDAVNKQMKEIGEKFKALQDENKKLKENQKEPPKVAEKAVVKKEEAPQPAQVKKI